MARAHHHGKKRPKKWIAKAVHGRRKGALHRHLHVPEGQRIPEHLLRVAAKHPGRVGREARLALTLRKFHRKERDR